MIAAIQRVSKAAVHVNDEEISSIEEGLLILLGVASGDTEEDARLLATKCAGLRIFDDEERHMNRSIDDVRGSFLVISQFTLLADCRKGRRPSFTDAASPEDAAPLVEIFVDTLKEQGFTVKTGIFGARMEISLVNSGPVTIILDSGVFRQSRRKSKRDGT